MPPTKKEEKEAGAAEDKQPESKERYVLTEMPTEHETVIVDTKTKIAYNQLAATLHIMNGMEEIRKTLGTTEG